MYNPLVHVIYSHRMLGFWLTRPQPHRIRHCIAYIACWLTWKCHSLIPNSTSGNSFKFSSRIKSIALHLSCLLDLKTANWKSKNKIIICNGLCCHSVVTTWLRWTMWRYLKISSGALLPDAGPQYSGGSTAPLPTSRAHTYFDIVWNAHLVTL